MKTQHNILTLPDHAVKHVDLLTYTKEEIASLAKSCYDLGVKHTIEQAPDLKELAQLVHSKL